MKLIKEDDLVYRLHKRAEIRRQITSRKSVQNNEPDRIADLLEEASDEIAQLRMDKEALKAKTLSIGEIHAVWAAGKYYELDKNGQVDEIKFTEFAYAILRKAQEK